MEDPIQILHQDNLAIIDQREIGVDTDNFTSALRSVARQDPDQARLSLANSLKGILCQRLVPKIGSGRVAMVEAFVMTQRLYEFVADPEKTDDIADAIAEGAYYVMQTFDQHLLELYRAGEVTMRDAMSASTSPHDFKIAVRKAGLQIR
ncbi:MAG: hypothetical protein ACR2HR_16815 [Euzebya sp.]